MYRPPHSLSCLSTAMDTPSFQQTHKTLLGTDFANDKPPNICSLHTPLIIYEVSTKTQHARKPTTMHATLKVRRKRRSSEFENQSHPHFSPRAKSEALAP
ncbi:hypothetical protein M0657_003689 [Pyricularia oryzae]|uniref:Uncharacterized protein n=1 Tax=Pyricularia oryzae TaxID=318829 RepID=A0A4P7NJ33_PYROR|nr:hypothetical protein M9X92_007594 [Pyricularia oryzae]KAI7926456.1 hypothetical protein M0657_003689 [Pyricularia oryzae]QBZ62034.1 hypothetical protein PoMZ_10908 [Pyricularia oryzae]